MKILITNDDGINAKGLKILASIAKDYGEVLVVAPKHEQSGKSHSIIIREDVEFNQVKDIVPNIKSYELDSTPADCVRVAHHYLKYDFDIVFAGINEGYNIGEDIVYSGTTAAAEQGAMLGKKAVAFSTDYKCLDVIKDDLEKAVKFVFDNKILNAWNFYNINVPPKSKGVKFSAQGCTHYTCEFLENRNNNKNNVVSIGRPVECPDSIENSDVGYTYEKYITCTPLNINRTNFEILNKLLK